MGGQKSLRKIQMGLESTKGTAVPATFVFRGQGTLQDDREVVDLEEDVGLFSGADRTLISKLGGTLEMEDAACNFEQLPYILSAAIKDLVAGVQDGAGSGYIYNYTGPTTTPNDIKSYTIEAGDNQQAEEMEYCQVSAFKISGTPTEALMLAATWFGRQVANTTYTGALTIPTVEDIPFSKGKLFIDAIGGTIGTTQVTETFINLELNYTTGWIPLYSADGQTFFSKVKVVKPEVTCEITFEHDATAVAQKTAWRAETPQLVRIQFEGSDLATPGTTYSKKTLNIDFAAKIQTCSKLEEIDGNDIVRVTFLPKYNATAALFFNILVVNELSSLP